MVDALYSDKLHSKAQTTNQNVPYLPISFQPSIQPPPPVLRGLRSSSNPHQVIPTTDSVQPIPDQESGLSKEEQQRILDLDLNSDLIFHNEYYLTQIRSPESAQHIAGIHPEVQSWLKFGRPNLKEIFAKTSELCKNENISRVGVCVCGPSPMVNETIDLCNWSLLNPKCGETRFDCHSEVFDF